MRSLRRPWLTRWIKPRSNLLGINLMKKASHVIIIVSALFLIIGVPLLCNAEYVSRFIAGEADAVSSATLNEQEKPSGDYYVLINRQLHPDTIGEWEAFFSGDDVDLIFEDIDCLAIDTDISGLKYADYCKARLPENQMDITPENSMLAMSKLQWGKCDVFIISTEAADKYHLETVDDSVMSKIKIEGGET